MSNKSIESMFYQKENEKIRCLLCPHKCILAEGEFGRCKLRKVEEITGELKLHSPYQSRVAAICLDPIEKKPLYHFYPGSQVLSVGMVGCNLDCPFCQNWEISHSRDQDKGRKITPQDLTNILKEYSESEPDNILGLAFTYSEPTSWYEYVFEASKLSSEEGFKNVIVSNGFINKTPLKNLMPYIHGANIDVKGFRESTYKHVGGQLQPVMDTVELLLESKHVELTYLVIPEINDHKDELNDFINWVAELNPDIPVHFSRYFPQYKYEINATPVSTLRWIYEKAREKLTYVYLGNVGEQESQTTWCPKCKKSIIERVGFGVITNLVERNQCKFCNHKIAGEF